MPEDIPRVFIDMSGKESAVCKALFDREEILNRIFKLIWEAAFWAEMHERVSKMMREREEKRQRRKTKDRRLSSSHECRKFKGIDKSGKRI